MKNATESQIVFIERFDDNIQKEEIRKFNKTIKKNTSIFIRILDFIFNNF